MTSQDQFEAWASEHMPTLYLTKTEQGTYESTATGNFFAAWSARDGEIERLREECEAHLELIGKQGAAHMHEKLGTFEEYQNANASLAHERDQLKATVSDYEMGLEAAKEEIARLKGENEGLRRDAERYRWLRQDDVAQYQISTKYSEEKMDAAIDAAMSKGEQP